jgi:hypothetical protein
MKSITEHVNDVMAAAERWKGSAGRSDHFKLKMSLAAAIRQALQSVQSQTDGQRYRRGALRYFDFAKDQWVSANPGDLWFSTVTMLATEHFDGVQWVSIGHDDVR